MNMWFVVLMIVFASAQSTAQNSTTYLHIDQSTGQTLTCSRYTKCVLLDTVLRRKAHHMKILNVSFVQVDLTQLEN
ncbi:hypothetical protein AALO_G00259480 [Alosa alosa]|uniref:Secreted protein n=1 Tax=Alosa alosa TaxID=278164 RepID=A0AAV6FUT1_9TELE|nr:hypothetical protein AALO_G00259480 [Alosa alosa]